MSRLIKSLSYISAAFLIYFDISVVFSTIGLKSSGDAFDTMLQFFVPCGALFGISMILFLLKKNGYKTLCVISIILSAINCFIRTAALVYQFFEIANGTGANDTDEIILIIEFAAYAVLLAALSFFGIYLGFGKFRIAALSTFCVSAIALMGDWIWNLVRQINSFIWSPNSGITQFFAQNFTITKVQGVLALAAYAILILIAGGLFSDDKNASERNG